MSEMVERVARAMDPMSAKIADMLISKGLKSSDVLGILPMEKARAAIEAMREPTEAMVEYALDVRPIMMPDTPRELWEAMIDAALGEE